MPPLASIGRRFLALLIDMLVLFITTKIVHFIPVIGRIPLVMVVVFIIYSAWFESSKYRGTLGKIALGVEVTDLNGGSIPLKTAILRAVGKAISFSIMCIGFLFAYFSEKKQTLHDLIARTMVVESPKTPIEG